MSRFCGNENQLDRYLQYYINTEITLPEDKVKEANKSLKQVLLNEMEHRMKELDETFRVLYKQPHYVGSYYENLRVGHPNEFDINLEFELPVNMSSIKRPMSASGSSQSHQQFWSPSQGRGRAQPQRRYRHSRNFYRGKIETWNTEPGFAKIFVGKAFKQHISRSVIQRIESWLSNGYLCRDKVASWLQGVVDRVLQRIKWPPYMEVTRSVSGPAVTLLVQHFDTEFSVDLVPVFMFERDQWPSPPLRQPHNIPRDNINTSVKWCVVPKAPRIGSDPEFSKLQWRMSFYMHEKELMKDLGNMKPVIKLMKLLRDKQGWGKLSSYYLKTISMWMQQENKDSPSFWRQGLGCLFMHMLRKLEKYLLVQNIPFFWDIHSNLIAHLKPEDKCNMANRVKRLRVSLEKALETGYNLSSTISTLFTD